MDMDRRWADRRVRDRAIFPSHRCANIAFYFQVFLERMCNWDRVDINLPGSPRAWGILKLKKAIAHRLHIPVD